MMLDTWRLTTNSLHPSWCCMLPYTSCNPRNNRLHPSFFSQYCLQNLPQSKIYIEWVSPSSVSCGPNFFIFFTNFKMSHCNRMVLVRPSSCTIVELSPPPTLSLKHLLNQSGLYDSCSGTSEHKLDKLEHLEEHMHLVIMCRRISQNWIIKNSVRLDIDNKYVHICVWCVDSVSYISL